MIYRFTTVIHQEGKWHVAQCVELGVVSQGKTIEEAQKNLQEAVALYLEDEPKSKKYLIRKPAYITTVELEYA
ncbi:type II toxin-antitoxin system HicB family antitoxin [bacterium (Candidatus Torokbacteria) CG09_land_8_20_14_0_10_42_11]|nr:MAG: type II toxin-antitoxin system HicB family antitoxin [bacterium (Candidatus Torokbacteria) CG09_land_8_20_14_0_10_42_11]